MKNQKPLKECAADGCHRSTKTRYCIAHTRLQKALQKARNLSDRSRFYKSPQWRATRQRIIARDKGICQCGCKERVPAKEIHIHHIVDRVDGGSDQDHNLVLLNKRHHSRITANRNKRNERGEFE